MYLKSTLDMNDIIHIAMTTAAYTVFTLKQAKTLKNNFQNMDFLLPAYDDHICLKIQSCRYVKTAVA